MVGALAAAAFATALAIAVRGDLINFEDWRNLVEGYLETVVVFRVTAALVT